MKNLRGTLVAAAAVAATIAVSNAGAAQQPRLIGTVGFGQITLKTEAGAPVKTLRAGTYVVSVVDRSQRDNFHLKGPNINRQTGAAFEGVANWTVRFRKGTTVRYYSDKSPKLTGSFRVH